jgi:hypothetical protein
MFLARFETAFIEIHFGMYTASFSDGVDFLLDL